MGKFKRKPYRVWCIFDTETSNVVDAEGCTRAFPILYIVNDVHEVPMSEYEVDHPLEVVSYYRYEEDMLAYIDDVVEAGIAGFCIPVMCVYNAIFDLQTILYRLHDRYEMKVNAQSSTNIYTLDLLRDGKVVMRIWDTYHLEMGGLKAMGRTCGVAKLLGEWDYDLVRTPETPLTAQELEYAKRDTQVIPAYLRYLCDANEWLTPDMLGVRVLTKTSLVRQMARNEIGPLKVGTRKGKPLRLLEAFEALCSREQPRDYESYALRLACFRGGLTFTAASVASLVLHNVCSIDETSAHHAFLNGRRVPIQFDTLSESHMRLWLWDIGRYSLDDVLHRYAYPFQRWFHMEIEFSNLRLRHGSCFESWGIGLLAQAKFTARAARSDLGEDNERHLVSEDDIRSRGFGDSCEGATFAFGKLMMAERCRVHVTELEYWCMLQVYEWDECIPIRGEGTIKSIWPPDFVTLQSNILFERKNDAKVINEHYVQGTGYQSEIPGSIPLSIADALREGTLSENFVSSWYSSTVKGAFNSIYGTQAQNLMKPEYTVDNEGELLVNQETKTTPDNYDERLDDVKHPMVLYTYGMRIVGGSRMQLIIALMLMWAHLGNRVTCCGGDTDSIKVRCDADVTTDDILEALGPLHVAITEAIALSMGRLRETWPEKASTLDNVGCFEIERARGSKSPFYALHMEAWNKARVSVTQEGHAHITCAGLSRPEGAYTIEHWLSDMQRRGFDLETLLPLVLGYNVTITHDVCHALEHRKPLFVSMYEADVTDYLGMTAHVRTHEAIALAPTNRKMGDTLKHVNEDNVRWIRNMCGRDVNTDERVVTAEPNVVAALALTLLGERATWTMARAFLDNFWIPRLYKQTEFGMEEVRA